MGGMSLGQLGGGGGSGSGSRASVGGIGSRGSRQQFQGEEEGADEAMMPPPPPDSAGEAPGAGGGRKFKPVGAVSMGLPMGGLGAVKLKSAGSRVPPNIEVHTGV